MSDGSEAGGRVSKIGAKEGKESDATGGIMRQRLKETEEIRPCSPVICVPECHQTG